jgi:SAM-dependent methyltransferase
MLRAARARCAAPAIQADAVALPLADGAADAAILAYVLFHVSDPPRALAEAARVLRPGGRVATVTWSTECMPRAFAVLDELMAQAGIAPSLPRRQDTGLDSPGAMADALRAAGLPPERVWLEQLHRQWDRESFLRLVTGMGTTMVRLNSAGSELRDDVLARLDRELGRIAAEDLRWEGEVICAVARKPGPGGGGGG